MLKIKNLKNEFKITPNRIALVGVLLALLVALKYAFGFVPGIETTTFLFIIFGIFLPILDLGLLVLSFNFIILAIYGVSYWWIMYWIIWPLNAFVSKLLSLKIKNIFVFALWGFIAGATIGFWEFILNLSLQGVAFARLSLISAIPINAIEGLTTMLLIIILAIPIQKVFAIYSHKFWDNPPFKFNEVKNFKISTGITISLSLFSLSGIISLYATNDLFTDWQNREIRKSFAHNPLLNDVDPQDIYDRNNKLIYDGNRLKEEPTQHNKFLYNTDYNKIQKVLKDKPGKQVAIVVIANNRYYTEILDLDPLKWHKVINALEGSKRFEFNISHGVMFEFKFKKYLTQIASHNFLHGTSNKMWDAISVRHYYPLYYLNHIYASLYISNQDMQENDIIELSYDHS